ncbi:MAG: L-threonylcarbamoyladenylate synthase [Methanobacterium sp.]|nr:L-threonylcarbamoyladenylate synthase [Methanobacterium sp.]
MKTIKIGSHNQEKVIKTALNILKNGGTVIYPTDTIYGMGANAFNHDAVKKVYEIKRRSYKKPISVCVSDVEDIKKIAHINEFVEKKINQLFPGPFTVILKKKDNIPPILTSGSENIGIRIPDNEICREISRDFPITTTSANISGEKIPGSVEEIIMQLDDKVDLIIDAGVYKKGIHSTVIDMTVSPPKILRSGAVIPDLE